MSKIKILLVEDVPIAQKVATVVLKEIGCEVDTANTGSQAIQLINDNQYALVFMDLGLPDLDGLTVTEMIRKTEKEGTHAPIIALTAHKNDYCKEACHESGLDDVLVKPLTDENSRQVINKFVGTIFA